MQSKIHLEKLGRESLSWGGLDSALEMWDLAPFHPALPGCREVPLVRMRLWGQPCQLKWKSRQKVSWWTEDRLVGNSARIKQRFQPCGSHPEERTKPTQMPLEKRSSFPCSPTNFWDNYRCPKCWGQLSRLCESKKFLGKIQIIDICQDKWFTLYFSRLAFQQIPFQRLWSKISFYSIQWKNNKDWGTKSYIALFLRFWIF